MQKFKRLCLTYETRNLIEVVKMLGSTSLNRKETGGGHFRIDYPEIDNENFLENYVIWQKTVNVIMIFGRNPKGTSSINLRQENIPLDLIQYTKFC